MLFAQVNAQSRAELDQALQAAQAAKWYRRLQVIALSSQGYQVSQIAPMTKLSEATIRRSRLSS